MFDKLLDADVSVIKNIKGSDLESWILEETKYPGKTPPVNTLPRVERTALKYGVCLALYHIMRYNIQPDRFRLEAEGMCLSLRGHEIVWDRYDLKTKHRDMKQLIARLDRGYRKTTEIVLGYDLLGALEIDVRDVEWVRGNPESDIADCVFYVDSEVYWNAS